jgi:nucleotide-binding universal stress UspA family protein
MGYNKILVALDRSEQSQVVFEQALEIAKHNQSNLLLFHCLPVQTGGMNPYGNLYGQELVSFSQAIQDQIDREIAQTRQWLNEYAYIATQEGITVEFDWKIGDPGGWVREIAKSWEADLVVIGRRGFRGLTELFLGSVSNHVIHHVSCSVLVVQGVINRNNPDE